MNKSKSKKGKSASGGTKTGSGGTKTGSGGNKSGSGDAKTASGDTATASGGTANGSNGTQTASGGAAASSSGTATVSGGTGTASNCTGVALGNFVRERKDTSRKPFFGTAASEEKEILDNEHVAGMKNDFAYLLNVPTDCNFFQFKSEKDWDENTARNTFSCQKLFNLNLEFLSQGLECLPFYDKITMDKSKLPESDVKIIDRKAGEAQEKYKEIRQNFEKEIVEHGKFSQSFEDLLGIKWELRKPKVVKPEEAEKPVEEMDQEAPHHGKFWLSHRTELKEKGDDSYLAPSSSDESLEIWLDTYLED